ncbi:MAG TPA: hypothetical protein VHK02_06790 [Actinomycetota bacterium]|nr:hypothetical protein [Actinomycetota bacterium]
MTTLPRELLETNAAPLLAIVSELQASSVIEIGVIQAVGRVKVDDPQAIRRQREILEDYQQRRLYDRDRTHCSNIDRIATQLRAPLGQSPSTKLDELNAVLQPLRHADDDLLDDIEQILGDSLAAIREIEASNRLVDAEAAQARFMGRMQPAIDRMKRNLSQMNALTGQLIDLM